jgi:hypothetical protein
VRIWSPCFAFVGYSTSTQHSNGFLGRLSRFLSYQCHGEMVLLN